MDVVVIGCGNSLRGDDAVGPELVRRLRDRGPPAGVRCVDAGTGGLDAVLLMRGADEAVLVDACRSGAEPGTLRELPAEAVAQAPPAGVDVHSIRWDHALALGRAVLGAAFPRRVTVWLVEAATFEPGAPLSPAVDRGVDAVLERLVERLSRPYVAFTTGEA